jgi:hypothetical protein
MKTHICFVGKVPVRQRWYAVRWTLYGLWAALRGYYPHVHLVPETGEEARWLVVSTPGYAQDTEAKHATGSLTVN